ncbi:sugar ABC transporter permease [Candidatus Sumerlaeota bacterium]|nr:sugar ABC transporter permease [Candidatus Sumerlaeota bacterium]
MNRNFKNLVIFLGPLVVFVSLFALIPVIGTFWISLFRDVSFLPEKKFVGISQYVKLFRDGQTLRSIWFTFIFALTSVFLEMLLGVMAALVINENFRGRNVLRGMILIPWAIPSVVGARIWQLIFRYDYGAANYVLRGVFGIHINWTATPLGALCVLVVADAWRTTSFVAIIILAGLQTVPEELYEQGRIDGADLFKRFFHITLPAIKPVVIVALLFRTIDALRVFDILYIITNGGPSGATTSLSLYSYQYFLMGDFGYGSAVSVILFLMAFLCSLFYLKAGRFREAVS